MKNIEDINKAVIQKITANKKITDFSPGDTIKVGVKIVEGKRERIQYFEGCLLYTSPSPRDGLLSRMPSSA